MQYVIFGIILIAFAVLVIKSYAKKLAAGCCGAGGKSTRDRRTSVARECSSLDGTK